MFKSKNTLEKRTEEFKRIFAKYPDRIPIIVEKAGGSDVPSIDKTKYLVPSDLTIGQFMYVVRKRIKLKPEKAIFMFINNNIFSPNTLVSEVYKNNKDKDGFLYTIYSGENTFG